MCNLQIVRKILSASGQTIGYNMLFFSLKTYKTNQNAHPKNLRTRQSICHPAQRPI